jgi:predicted ABC-type ATPase
MSHVIIIAGPNGAGKTTTAPALLNKALTIHNFVNADTIAAGFCAFAPETAAIQAGRAMLNRMQVDHLHPVLKSLKKKVICFI